MLKTKLETDFRDYYDHVFYSKYDQADMQFVRVAHDPAFSIPKSQQLSILSKFFAVPVHGLVKDMPASIEYFVVYTDELAHQGNGKLLLSKEQALASYPDYFCSQYINPMVIGKSTRFLQIGNRSFAYNYNSKQDWRSNCGDVYISRPTESKHWGMMVDIYNNETFDRNHVPFSQWPMFAIDVVHDESGKMFAIDLNTAPGLRHTGMDEIISPVEIYDEITSFLSSK